VLTEPQVISKKEQQFILKEHQCIQEVLLAEAFGEPLEGIEAVLSVLYYRKLDGRFGMNYCDVAHSSKQFSYRNHLKKGQIFHKTKKDYTGSFFRIWFKQL